MTKNELALERIFSTMCSTLNCSTGQERQEGRISLEDYNLIRHALQQNEKLVGALKFIVENGAVGSSCDAARKALVEFEGKS